MAESIVVEQLPGCRLSSRHRRGDQDAGEHPSSRWRSGFAQIPPDAGVGHYSFACWGHQQMLVRSVLLAAVVAVRNPDQWKTEIIHEFIARKSARGVWDHLHPLTQRLFHTANSPADPRMRRIGPACGHPHGSVLDADIWKSLFVQVLTQCWFKIGGIAIHGIANLAVRCCIRGNSIDRVLRSAREHRQHNKAVPAVDFLGRGKAGFTPVGVDIGGFAAATNRAAAEYLLAPPPGRHSAVANHALEFSLVGR